MIRRIQKILGFVGCLGGSLAFAAGPPEATMPEGLVFQDLELVWEGGLSEGRLVGTGRLEGVEHAFQLSQETGRDENGLVMKGEMELPESRVDLGKFLAIFPATADWKGEGIVGIRVKAERKEGEWSGSGRVTLREVRLENEPMGMVLRDLAGTLDIRFAEGKIFTPPGQVLTFAGIDAENVMTGPGELEFQLVSAEELRVELAVLHWAGGQLSAGGFSFQPTRPDFSVRLFASGIELGQLLSQASALGARGTGLIDGDIEVEIRPDRVKVKGGKLFLRSEVEAKLELPPRAWFTKGMSSKEASFKNLQRVERALEALNLDRFEIKFAPDGEDEPDLRLQIGGRSSSPDLPVTPISLTLNVYGPVRDLGNWFLSPEVSIGMP